LRAAVTTRLNIAQFYDAENVRSSHTEMHFSTQVATLMLFQCAFFTSNRLLAEVTSAFGDALRAANGA
jgi:hypothetical protein